MLDLIDLFCGTQEQEGVSDGLNEAEFACIYAAYYPYLGGNA